jgi:hypothetical protein
MQSRFTYIATDSAVTRYTHCGASPGPIIILIIRVIIFYWNICYARKFHPGKAYHVFEFS